MFKRTRIAILMATVLSVGYLVGIAGPAAATYPLIPCDSTSVEQGYESLDGERWVCRYDGEAKAYFWEYVGGGSSTFGYANQANGDCDRIQARTELIGSQLFTGADEWARRPCSAPLYRSAGSIASLSYLYRWNGSAWDNLGNTGWNYSTTYSDRHTPTWTWGSPSSGFYASYAFGAHYNNGWRSTYIWSGYTYYTNNVTRSTDPGPPPPTAARPPRPMRSLHGARNLPSPPQASRLGSAAPTRVPSRI